MADPYADAIALTALVVSASALGWQINIKRRDDKIKRRDDRPNLIMENPHVTTDRESWCASVIVANVGNVQTTLMSIEWEFEYESNRPGIIVGGPAVGNTWETDRGVLPRDAGQQFVRRVLGQNQKVESQIRIDPDAFQLRESHRARPVVQFIIRPKGFETAPGDWCEIPGNAQRR
jgi:hypothetical protein